MPGVLCSGLAEGAGLDEGGVVPALDTGGGVAVATAGVVFFPNPPGTYFPVPEAPAASGEVVAGAAAAGAEFVVGDPAGAGLELPVFGWYNPAFWPEPGVGNVPALSRAPGGR